MYELPFGRGRSFAGTYDLRRNFVRRLDADEEATPVNGPESSVIEALLPRCDEILIGGADFDVCENGGAGVGRNGRGIDDLQVAADRGAVNDAQFQIAELEGRALQTSSRSLGEIDYRILAVAILENGQAHRDRVARIEVAGKGVEGQESSESDNLMAVVFTMNSPPSFSGLLKTKPASLRGEIGSAVRVTVMVAVNLPLLRARGRETSSPAVPVVGML